MLSRLKSWQLFLLTGVSAIGAWPLLYFVFGAAYEALPAGRDRDALIAAYQMCILLFALAIIGFAFFAISRSSKWIWWAGLLGLIIMMIVLLGAIGSWFLVQCHALGRGCF